MTRWDVVIQLIQAGNYRHVAEIGVNKGKTAFKVLASCSLDEYILVDPVEHLPLRHIVKYQSVASSHIMTS